MQPEAVGERRQPGRLAAAPQPDVGGRVLAQVPPDLVDLVLLSHLESFEPERVKRALRATFETRNTHSLPAQLPSPPLDWDEPYAALGRELDLPAQSLSEAFSYLDAWWQELR